MVSMYSAKVMEHFANPHNVGAVSYTHLDVYKRQYLLTTKLFCGKCGTLMGGESGTSHMGNTLSLIHI